MVDIDFSSSRVPWMFGYMYKSPCVCQERLVIIHLEATLRTHIKFPYRVNFEKIVTQNCFSRYFYELQYISTSQMVQKATNSPALSRKPNLVDRQRQPRQSIVSDVSSVKSYPISIEAPSDVTCESGYETITDVVCKGPLLYYKPRWFGESWKTYDAVLTNDGVFRWYKKGSDPAELEGTLALRSIPNGLITFGRNTENIPKEQQVRFPKEFTFQPAIAIGEPYSSGEIFWFLCPSTDMIRLWEQGFRDLVAAEKFSSGSSVYSSWKKYSPERPVEPGNEREPHKEAGWHGADVAIIMALDFAM